MNIIYLLRKQSHMGWEMRRYDLEIDIRLCDDAATMYECEKGKYVTHCDAQEKIDALQEKIDAASDMFTNFKNLNIKHNSVDELNMIASEAIEALK